MKISCKSSLCLAAFAAAMTAAPHAKADVDVYVDCGTLHIEGDSSADKVAVTQTGYQTWRVTTSGGTKINNQVTIQALVKVKPLTSAEFEGVYKSIEISLEGGKDSIYLHDGAIPRSLKIDTGDGNDTITVTNITIGESSGPQPAIAEAASISGSKSSSSNGFNIKGGDGNDSIALNNVIVDCSYNNNNASILGSSSNSRSKVAGCDGADKIAVQNVQARKLEVTGGDGKDTILVQLGVNQEVQNDCLDIDSGDDTDKVSVAFCDSEDLTVEVGPGNKDALSVDVSTSEDARFKDCGTKGTIKGSANSFYDYYVSDNFTIQKIDLGQSNK